jgi:hypothetical protein
MATITATKESTMQTAIAAYMQKIEGYDIDLVEEMLPELRKRLARTRSAENRQALEIMVLCCRARLGQ